MKFLNRRIRKAKRAIEDAEYIVIGAGAGLSTSAGIEYSGKRFTDNFQDFIDSYGLQDMYSATFYPFESEEEKWAYLSRHVLLGMKLEKQRFMKTYWSWLRIKIILS